MNAGPDVERLVSRWLVEEAPERAPDRILETAALTIDRTKQRRALRVPWRFPQMNIATRLAAVAIVAVVAVAGISYFAGRTAPGVGNGPTLSPTVAPLPSPASSPTLTPTASSRAAVDTSGWKGFTSPRDGYQISHPTTWTVKAATAPWPVGTAAADPPDPTLDVFTDPSDPTRPFAVTSSLLPVGEASGTWLVDYARTASTLPGECWPSPPQMQRGTIDGETAWINGGKADCGFTRAIVFAGARVYEFSAYFPLNATPFDRTLFDALLSTVKLQPTGAK